MLNLIYLFLNFISELQSLSHHGEFLLIPQPHQIYILSLAKY